MKKLVAGLVVGAMVTSGAMASEPVQLSLTPEIAIFDPSETINGVSLGIWSENPQSALALGIVNGSTGRSAGLSIALILNYTENYSGVQWAPINYAAGDFLGWQSGVVNYTEGLMKGLQTGVVNYAGRLTGFQLGFINYAETAEAGVQIGVLNLIPQNEWFTGFPSELAPGMVFVNWRY